MKMNFRPSGALRTIYTNRCRPYISKLVPKDLQEFSKNIFFGYRVITDVNLREKILEDCLKACDIQSTRGVTTKKADHVREQDATSQVISRYLKLLRLSYPTHLLDSFYQACRERSLDKFCYNFFESLDLGFLEAVSQIEGFQLEDLLFSLIVDENKPVDTIINKFTVIPISVVDKLESQTLNNPKLLSRMVELGLADESRIKSAKIGEILQGELSSHLLTPQCDVEAYLGKFSKQLSSRDACSFAKILEVEIKMKTWIVC